MAGKYITYNFLVKTGYFRYQNSILLLTIHYLIIFNSISFYSSILFYILVHQHLFYKYYILLYSVYGKLKNISFKFKIHKLKFKN